MKKFLLVLLIILVCLALLVILGANIYFKAPIANFYLASEKGFKIPGLNTGFNPQGLTYDSVENNFLVSGHMKDGGASPVYIVDMDEEKSKKVYMVNLDDSIYSGHSGGIAVHGDYTYIAGSEDNLIYVFSYPAMLIANDGDYVKCLGTIEPEEGMKIAFLTIDNGKLIAGEFYREENWPTPEHHHASTSIQESYHALAYGYAFSDSENATYGIDPTPCAAYSLPDQAQGMAFNGGRIYVSTSYGGDFSHVYSYSVKAATRRNTMLTVCGHQVPFYELDSGTQVDDIKIPPMSEEIEFVDDKMYTMNESASNQYFFGKLTSGKWCYATEVTRMWSL